MLAFLAFTLTLLFSPYNLPNPDPRLPSTFSLQGVTEDKKVKPYPVLVMPHKSQQNPVVIILYKPPLTGTCASILSDSKNRFYITKGYFVYKDKLIIDVLGLPNSEQLAENNYPSDRYTMAVVCKASNGKTRLSRFYQVHIPLST